MARPKTEKLVTLIGGSGFIGRHIVRALAREGYRVRVACRRPDLAGHLQPLGNLGQIQMIQANVRYPESLEAACRDSFAVINLVGLLANSGPQTFDACHVEGTEACARAAKAAKLSSAVTVPWRRMISRSVRASISVREWLAMITAVPVADSSSVIA